MTVKELIDKLKELDQDEEFEVVDKGISGMTILIEMDKLSNRLN